ncbi:fimbrial protein [Scandinavium sp. NPDC088450]|uniref:fimbrial protein n=1 Tax=Scandinavium sp. NPDC088450 TaxID=3364514 RepID=UPI00384B7357
MKLSLPIIILISMLPYTAFADGTLNISGKVVASACTVDVNTVDRTIDLGSIQSFDLRSPTSGGEWVDFTLEVNQCPAGLNFATAKFSGDPDSNDVTTYKNTGTSTGASLQLGARTTIYGNGTSMKSSVDPSTHKATFPLSARIYSAKGNATSGTFHSVVNLTFTYQ